MFVPKVSTLTSLFVYLTCIVEVYMTSYKFKQITEVKFNQTFVTETVEKPSVIQCAFYCTSKQGCVSLSWEPYQTQCLLSERDVTHEPEYYYSLEYAAGWNTYTMPQYQVYVIDERDEETRYTLDFSEATRACNDRGTRLASPSDLLAARSQGFGYCYCGWMSDGRNGFVLQAQDPGCWSSFTTDIIICGRSRAGAWCLQN